MPRWAGSNRRHVPESESESESAMFPRFPKHENRHRHKHKAYTLALQPVQWGLFTIAAWQGMNGCLGILIDK
jgi:hypothetical protein